MSDHVSHVDEELTTSLLDVSQWPLTELDTVDGSVLSVALQRIIGGEDFAPVAGFQSSI
jgi:FXSXX-COOH protein